MNEPLNEILHHPRIWRAAELRPQADQDRVATGFAALDATLAGGWPLGAVTEILFAEDGMGELRLIMPALARLSRRPSWLAWIAPPYIPYAPALAGQGIALSRVMVVHPRSDADALWAVEQALRSGTCAAVLTWVKQADERSIRRLQLAAEEGGGWCILFRPQLSVVKTSPAALRLKVEPRANGVAVQVLKRRGGWPVGPLFLEYGLESGQEQKAVPAPQS